MTGARVARFFLVHDTNTGKNVPNEHKINKMFIKNICKILQMAIKYINNLQSMALLNLPKEVFLV
jgi:hypothetical protein